MNLSTLSLCIGIAVAIASILSPVIVAIINNRHNARIKRMELDHDYNIKVLESKQASTQQQFNVYYADKRRAFECFAETAGNYLTNRSSSNAYGELHSAISHCILFCSLANQDRLVDFGNYIQMSRQEPDSRDSRNEYLYRFFSICLELNAELVATQPNLDYFNKS